MYIALLAGAVLLGLAVLVFLATYKVVDPNDAHIVVRMGSGRKLYAPRLGAEQNTSTSYFFIPFLMTKQVLPLTNVKMNISDIHLNDSEVAPFVCDVITWIRINDPIMAAERLNPDHEGGAFGSLSEDLKGIVHAISREVAMKQEIIEILKDRKTFSASVSGAVGTVLKQWGVELVNLEVNDIKDDVQKNSRVIADYESIRKVQVNTEARKLNAQRDREAIEVEQTNRQASEIATATAEENLRKRQIEKDKAVGIAEQEQQTAVAQAQEVTNVQIVSAEKTLKVGLAKVSKEATIEEALGRSEAIRIEGEKKAEVYRLEGTAQADVTKLNGTSEAEVTRLKGQAEGTAISAKGLAEAAAKDKMADAMAKFNEAATGIEKIRAWVEVQKSKYDNLGLALSNADLKLVTSGKGSSLFGFDLNAETGADIGQMMEAMGDNKVKDVISGLPKGLQEMAKDAIEKYSKKQE